MPVMRVVPQRFCDGDQVVAVLLYNGFQLLLFIAQMCERLRKAFNSEDYFIKAMIHQTQQHFLTQVL